MNGAADLPFARVDRRRSSQTTSGRAERDAAVAAMAAHPAMPEALHIFFAGIVGLVQGNRLLSLMMSDRSRLILAWLTLYLDACYDGRDPLSGLTVNRYKALCMRSGRSSPGRAVAMLGLMRFAGYLEPAARVVRGLPLRLVPTEKLVRPQLERVRVGLTAMAKLRPEGAIGLAQLDDPAHLRTLIRCLGEQILAREPLIEHGPGLSLFADRKAGLAMLMALMLSAEPGDTMPPLRPVSVPIKQLSRRFGVARAQVRDMLRDGVACGLLVPERTGENSYVMTPQLRASVVGFTAAIFLVLAEAVVQVRAEISAGPRPIKGVA